MSLFPPYKFSVFCNMFFGDALCRRRKILRFRYELRRKPRKHQRLRGLLYHKWVVSEWLVTIFRL